jgi:hypothetical protein
MRPALQESSGAKRGDIKMPYGIAHSLFGALAPWRFIFERDFIRIAQRALYARART